MMCLSTLALDGRVAHRREGMQSAANDAKCMSRQLHKGTACKVPYCTCSADKTLSPPYDNGSVG